MTTGFPFVDRQRELADLRVAQDQALAGRGGLVMLSGEPGIGKTRLAEELSEEAAARGALVLWGRCYETTGAPPYWPWVQVLSHFPEQQLPPTLQQLIATGQQDPSDPAPQPPEYLPGMGPGAASDSEALRFRLFNAVTRFLKGAARQQPLVLVLDNLHWADKPSLLLLEFLAQDMAESPILVVGTYRDSELSRRHPLSDTLGELTRQRLFQRIALHGLKADDVDQFLMQTTGSRAPKEVVTAIHAQTEGNPLFITEIVRLLGQEGYSSPGANPPGNSGLQPGPGRPGNIWAIDIPEGVRGVIGRRLNRLSEECNSVLSIAAVVGRQFSLAELKAILPEWPEENLLSVLEEAVDARVIEESRHSIDHYQFAHAMIRETLQQELSTARRVRLHRQIAEALEEVYGGNLEPCLDRLAYHYCEAAQSGTVDLAIDYARRAAQRADSILAYEMAAQHYEMALQVLELVEVHDEEQRYELLTSLGVVYRKAAETRRALDVLREAAGMARQTESAERLARAALEFEEASYQPGLPGHEAVKLLEEARRALPPGDSPLLARVLGGTARALVFCGQRELAGQRSRESISMARRLGDPVTLLGCLRPGVFPYLDWPGYQNEVTHDVTEEMVQLAEQAGDRQVLMSCYGIRMMSRLRRSDRPGMDADLERTASLAEELQQPYYLQLSTVWRAMRAILDGEFAAGERLALGAAELGQRVAVTGDPSGVFGTQMFTLRRDRGQLAGLEGPVRQFAQQEPAAVWRPGMALVCTELGLLDEARRQFEELARDDFASIPRDALWPMCLAYLAEVCAALGDRPRAMALQRLLRPYAGQVLMAGSATVCLGATAHYLGMLAAVQGQWDEAEDCFQEALERHASLNARPWLARTQYRYALMLLDRRRPYDVHKARRYLTDAQATAAELGMTSLGEEIAAALYQQTGPQPAPAAYPDGLSPREVEVIRLLAQGKSNREIAAELVISLNTVANHVANILSKTGTVNRAEAAAYAIQHGLTHS